MGTMSSGSCCNMKLMQGGEAVVVFKIKERL